MNLYLIRHARQNSRRCNVDVELAPEGIRQAELLAQRLKNYPIQRLYSSDLIRALQTARILNPGSLEHRIKKEFREIDFGLLTGNTDEENRSHFGKFLEERAELSGDLAFPGGESGEQVFCRAMPIINAIASEDTGDTAIVTHGGTIRCLLAGILGIPQAKKLLFGVTLENCSITVLRYDRKYSRYTLERFNDFAHLEPYPELQRRNWKEE